MTHTLLFTIFTIFVVSSFSYEVDQFTGRNKPIQDSLKVLDAEITSRLVAAVKETNSGFFGLPLGAPTCDGTPQQQEEARLKLFQNLRDILTTQSPVGRIEEFAIKNKTVGKRIVDIDQSIYSEAKEKSIILKRFGIGPVINVNGVQIGTDKLGHFIDEGYELYRENFRKEKSQRNSAAARASKSSEVGALGLGTTGVYSYADSAANFDGADFWYKLCGKKTANMSEEDKKYFDMYKCLPNSYLKCEHNKWVFNPKQKFTLAAYVNPAWDESINCSSYDESISQSVFKKLQALSPEGSKNALQPCPVEPQKCIDVSNRYLSSVKNKIVNPICQNIASKLKKGNKVDPTQKFDYTYNIYNKSNGELKLNIPNTENTAK